MKAFEHTSDPTSCDKAIEAMGLYWESGELTTAQWNQLIHQFPDCQEKLEELHDLWQKMGEIPTPEPSQGMHARFYHMLNQYEQEMVSKESPIWKKWWEGLGNFGRNGKLSWAMGLLLFFLGVFTGPYLRPNYESEGIRQLSQEVQQMRELTLLTLIKQSSATERLKGIHLTRNIVQPDPSIISALGETLTNDPNVNVRLSALEALAAYANLPEVRELLIQAISYQDSPIIQLALAELMQNLQEGNALDELKELLNAPGLEPEVKEHLQETINSLT